MLMKQHTPYQVDPMLTANQDNLSHTSCDHLLPRLHSDECAIYPGPSTPIAAANERIGSQHSAPPPESNLLVRPGKS